MMYILFEVSGHEWKQAAIPLELAAAKSFLQRLKDTYPEKVYRLALEVPDPNDTIEENIEYMLSRCPYTIRSREGGGAEDLLSSLILTFSGMRSRLERSIPFQDWKHGDR